VLHVMLHPEQFGFFTYYLPVYCLTDEDLQWKTTTTTTIWPRDTNYWFMVFYSILPWTLYVFFIWTTDSKVQMCNGRSMLHAAFGVSSASRTTVTSAIGQDERARGFVWDGPWHGKNIQWDGTKKSIHLLPSTEFRGLGIGKW
jgi:hypothetical protein